MAEKGAAQVAELYRWPERVVQGTSSRALDRSDENPDWKEQRTNNDRAGLLSSKEVGIDPRLV